MATYSKEPPPPLNLLFVELLPLLCKKLNIFRTSFTNSVIKRELDGLVPLKQAAQSRVLVLNLTS